MITIKASFEILSKINGDSILRAIELAGRVCYKSEENITKESAKRFVSIIIKRGHESVLEHQSISVRFISNRGFTHENVRHRIGSYSQESTRFCNYSKDKFNNQITCIDLVAALELQNLIKNFSQARKDKILFIFEQAWVSAEKYYFELLSADCTPEIARNALPIGLKTEIIVTYNLRQWREFFRQRAAPEAHPNMRELTIPLLKEFQNKIPIIFDSV